MSLRAFLLALRPWSFPLTVAPIAVGVSVASRSSSASCSLSSILVTLLGGLSVHAFANLVNTLEDFKCGVDRRDNGAADRTLLDRTLTPGQVKAATGASLAVAGVCMLLTALHLWTMAPSPTSSLSPVTSLFLLCLLGVFVGYSYTGWPLRLKYRALGDVCVLVAFGPLLAMGACCATSGHLSGRAAILSLPLGMLTCAVLHANNARDMRSDRAAGVLTVANRIGFARSYRLFQLLYVLPFALLPFFAWQAGSLWMMMPAVMITQLQPLMRAFKALQQPQPKRTAAEPEGAGTNSSETVDICAQCAQFSAGYGAMLTLAILMQ